jgi:hypothetical protein
MSCEGCSNYDKGKCFVDQNNPVDKLPDESCFIDDSDDDDLEDY